MTEGDLEAVRAIVADVPPAVGRTIEANGGLDPRPGSQLLQEIAQQEPYVGRRQRPVLNAYSIALTRWLAAMHHLVDLGRLLADERALCVVGCTSGLCELAPQGIGSRHRPQSFPSPQVYEVGCDLF